MQNSVRKITPTFLVSFVTEEERVVCWRSFYIFLKEKMFHFHCKCCIETRFSRCLSKEFAGFTVLICLVSTL